METQLADFIRDTAAGREADRILRKCVHCGFCTATCPTYQLLGDELDGPRGRIYLIKNVLEGEAPTASTRLHLDRCLTCRSCETTCPSGVQYGRLVDIGRAVVEHRATTARPWRERAERRLLRTLMMQRWLFDPAMALAQRVRGVLPESLRAKVPRYRAPGPWPTRAHRHQMLFLKGCVQPAMMPRINAATARVLDRAGVSLLTPADGGCCGGTEFHLNAEEAALARMRRNIDAWIPHLDRGVTTLVINASGCGAVIKDYGHYFADDPVYAERARRVSQAARDLSEVVLELMPRLVPHLGKGRALQLAFHPPCTLQHGQKIRGVVEAVLAAAGITVSLPEDAHLCCGSAGTYSITQPHIAAALRADKLAKLANTQAQAIVSANIGCIAHLQGGTTVPVSHWIEVLDQRLSEAQ